MDHAQQSGTPHNRAQHLIREFVEFSEKFGAQIPLAIPKGTLKTIDYYRDTYFKYLKDSEFKSNICYMLQLIEYQLWQYKLFKPQYSLESALFFQLLITQGIIIEAVVFALIANPLVISDSTDRSKGTTSAEHQNLLNLIRKRTFAAHIQQLSAMQIVGEAFAAELDRFRDEIRNLVHLQNWDGRLYRQIPQVDYNRHLLQFDQILRQLGEQVSAQHSLETLLDYYLLDDRPVRGIVKFFNRNSGRGQIEAKGPHGYIPYFGADIKSAQPPRKGDSVLFKLIVAEQGIRAAEIEIA